NSPYKFNGKELDDETGNYYYGARYYNPKWSIWLSVDPLAGDYPGWSPYNYTLQNPVKLVDPDGRSVDEVIITGEKAEEALSQLNASTNLNIERDEESGKLSISGGETKTKADKQLKEAIEDNNRVVEVNAVSTSITDDRKKFLGGAFGGND